MKDAVDTSVITPVRQSKEHLKGAAKSAASMDDSQKGSDICQMPLRDHGLLLNKSSSVKVAFPFMVGYSLAKV